MKLLTRIKNGGNVSIYLLLVKYDLDNLRKEWNEIGKKIRDKKKANKEDPCADEIALKNANENKQK